MEEAAGSIPASSTSDPLAAQAGVGHFVGGLVAAEGYFSRSVVGHRRDGSERGRYVFGLEMAAIDAPLVELLRQVLGVGSIRWVAPRGPRWQPSVCYTVNSRRAHRQVTVPFMRCFLPPSAKRVDFQRWSDLLETEERDLPSRWGRGPGTCSEPGCTGPVRGRGLCRRHYYAATGW